MNRCASHLFHQSHQIASLNYTAQHPKSHHPMPTPKAIWISSAYKICALQGFDALKIEPLAKGIGISEGLSKESLYV